MASKHWEGDYGVIRDHSYGLFRQSEPAMLVLFQANSLSRSMLMVVADRKISSLLSLCNGILTVVTGQFAQGKS